VTDNPCAVDRCDRPAGDAFVCRPCAAETLGDLVSVAWLVDQLGITLAKLDRIASTNDANASGTESPSPLHYPAVQALSTLTHTLKPWSLSVAERFGIDPPVRDDPWTHARALAMLMDRARFMPDAGQLVAEVRYAVREARKVIDRPPPLFYAGPCECGRDLYCRADDRGRPVAAVIRCQACRAQYDTTQRRAWLLDLVEDRIATVTEIARALPAVYGQPIRLGTLRVWITRGRLVPRAWLHNGRVYHQRQSERDRPLCRIGDVLDLVGQQTATQNGN
jgi:hypothetical protein